MRALLALGLLSLAVVGCSGSSGATSRPTVDPSSLNGIAPSEAPSTAPDASPTQQKLGDVIDIQCSDVDCMTVSVDKATFSKVYKDPANAYANDVPGKGDVFLAFHVSYKATGPNATYNTGDWAVYVGDAVADNFTGVVNGPQPELSARLCCRRVRRHRAGSSRRSRAQAAGSSSPINRTDRRSSRSSSDRSRSEPAPLDEPPSSGGAA